jgi:hypothetical protein
VKTRLFLGVTTLLLCLVAPLHTVAQVNAIVGGSVSDSTGALIPGVEISATNVNTGIVARRISNESGSYDFASLQPGTYTVSASLPGFQTATYNNVELNQGQQVRLNFTLEVGAAAQTVEVVADANTLLATTAASVGNTLPDSEVSSLPLATRNVLDLAAITTGSVGDNLAGARMSMLVTTRDGLPTTDGRYSDWNGAYSGTFTSPDLVEEVQVVLNNIDASSGRGSAQVRMRTRAGTNEYHGALFYTNNNASLNAQGWFENLVGAEKSYQNRNQFGGRIGGPIVPNKAFFFVLIDEQRFLEKQDVVSNVLTGPARQGIFRYLTEGAPGGTSRRNGNAFSSIPSVDLNGNVLSSDGGTPLFLNQIDLLNDVNDPNRTQIDPVWVGPEYLARMPLPNDWTQGDGLNTAGFRWLRRQSGSDSSTGSSPNTNRDHLTVRLDYQVSENNKVSYTMTREENWGVTGQTGLPDFPEGYFGEVKRFPDFYTASWTSTVSPTLLNEFRWGLKRDSWFGWSAFHKGCCVLGAAEDDITAESQEALDTYPQIAGKLFYPEPGLGLGTYVPFARGGAAPRFNPSPLWQFADTVSWTRGVHSFQTGFDYTRPGSGQNNSGGIATAYPHATLGVGNIPVPGIDDTNFPGLAAQDIGTAEDVLANLAGTINDISQKLFVNDPNATEFSDYTGETVFVKRDYRQNDWAAYFKDNWKVTNDLTLNLGIRYDRFGVPYDLSGMGQRPRGGEAGMFGISGTGFDALWDPFATGGSLTTAEPAGKHSPNPDVLVYNNDNNNIAPSIGWSWNMPYFDRPTVLRGGYGINYIGTSMFQQYGRQIGAQPGSQIQVVLSPSTYLDIAGVTAPGAGIVPLDAGGATPGEPVPLTNRATRITAYTDDRVMQYVQNWNLSVQRELTRDLTLEVSYLGNKGTKLWSAVQLNEPNIFENGILDAYRITQAGGDALLFDQMLAGIDLGGGVGAVGVDINPDTGNAWTGSEALRQFSTTDAWFANGDVASLAEWLNATSTGTGENGGLLRTNGFPENFIVVNPQFSRVELHGNMDNSIYHSLQTQVTKRLANGFSAQFGYTWSKTLGNSAANTGSGSSNTLTMRDARNRQLQRGLVAFHRTHNFKAHGTWELPFGPGRAFGSGAPSGIARLIEGWELSSVFSWTSGAPMEFQSTRETLIGNQDTNTADLVGVLPADLGSVEVGDGFVQYFSNLAIEDAPLPDFGSDPNNLAGDFSNQVVVDTSGNVVLQNPVAGTTGNTALNLSVLEGPSLLNLDLAMSKRVQIDESRSFTIRADMVNVLNTPQWGNPNTNINSGSFGRITSADGSRVITINARIDF